MKLHFDEEILDKGDFMFAVGVMKDGRKLFIGIGIYRLVYQIGVKW